jgi:hypothetical protein
MIIIVFIIIIIIKIKIKQLFLSIYKAIYFKHGIMLDKKFTLPKTINNYRGSTVDFFVLPDYEHTSFDNNADNNKNNNYNNNFYCTNGEEEKKKIENKKKFDDEKNRNNHNDLFVKFIRN